MIRRLRKTEAGFSIDYKFGTVTSIAKNWEIEIQENEIILRAMIPNQARSQDNVEDLIEAFENKETIKLIYTDDEYIIKRILNLKKHPQNKVPFYVELQFRGYFYKFPANCHISKVMIEFEITLFKN